MKKKINKQTNMMKIHHHNTMQQKNNNKYDNDDLGNTIDLFTDTAAISNSIVSNIYYGMFRGQVHNYLPPEHLVINI